MIKEVESGKSLAIFVNDKYFSYNGSGIIPTDIDQMIEYRINMVSASMNAANANNMDFVVATMTDVIALAMKQDFIDVYIENIKKLGLNDDEIQTYLGSAKDSATEKIRMIRNLIEGFCKAIKNNLKGIINAEETVKANADLVYNFYMYLIANDMFEGYDFTSTHTYHAVEEIKTKVCHFSGIITFKYI